MTTMPEARESLIAIVDDEACVRESLGNLIRSAGYEAKEYASAEDFLTWGSWEDTECLILDVRMPGMGGLELQRYLAEKQRARPIIFLSGHATGNEQTRAMTRGAVAFLTKPFSDESLLKAVEESIARSRATLDPRPATPHTPACPLCHESAPVAGIPGCFMHDHDDLRASSVEAIKTLNPAWTEDDGLCQRCWRFYVGLSRVVNFLRTPEMPPETNGEGDPVVA
jgi:CheY-like chemotaxis protein